MVHQQKIVSLFLQSWWEPSSTSDGGTQASFLVGFVVFSMELAWKEMVLGEVLLDQACK